MRTKPYAELLRDPRWKSKRQEILERDGHKCRECLRDDEVLHVHHVMYRGYIDPWDYPNEMLITLCQTCHKKEEELKADDLYAKVAELGVTRNHMMILADHIAFFMDGSKHEDAFYVFNEILEMIVPRERVKEFAKWRDGRRAHG